MRPGRFPSSPPLLLILLLAGGGAVLGQEILPFSEVRPGMRGVGKTVFSGTRVEDFQVEVIGTLERVAPQRNLILVRLSGGPLAQTGVLSGMSGSPVYLNDRLAGAVAYTWGFAREPIAGVTPIQEMLAIEDHERPAAGARAALPSAAGPAGLRYLLEPDRLPAHFASYFSRSFPGPAGAPAATPIGVPLQFSGVGPRVLEMLAPGLRAAGLNPVQGGAAARPEPGADGRLVPGSGVGIKLARGDVDIAAVCTVTHREQDRVLACGHPLLNLGPTELMMTGATVSGLFPSLQESFKFASAGEEIGAFRQDRSAGVLGYLGRKPRLIPVRVELRPERGRPARYAFDVVEDPFLGPYVLYAALNGILSSQEKDYGDVTLSYQEGSTVRVAGEEPIALRNLFSGEMARLYASGTVAFITQLLLNNEYRPVRLEGINLVLGYSDERRTARLERAWVSRDRVRAGDTLQVSAVLKPFQGPATVRQISIKVPDELPPGRLLLQVGDGLTLARTENESEDFAPRDLEQLIWLINHLRSNDTLYAVLTRSDNGIVFQGERLPNLPPSVAQVMVRPQTRGNYLRLLYRGVAEETLDTDTMLDGFKQITIDVED
ncbi:MAG: SpoIVB peptidase S55 domain-containing protein [Candidatus Polarisedimenticolia bacterium]